MCGIIGRVGKDDAVGYLLESLELLEYRGYDSAGVALCADGEIIGCKAVGRLSNLREKVSHKNLKGNSGIGHTRWATHGEPTLDNAHPHFSGDGNFAVVHNGIIENARELYTEELKGVVPVSDTDTEVIAHLLQKYYGGNVIDTIAAVTKLLEGSYALGILCRDYPDTVFCTAKNSPLMVAHCGDGGFITSDAGVIIKYTNEIYPIKTAQICAVTKDEIKFFASDGAPIKMQAVKTETEDFNSDKKGFEHFMMLEMMEQSVAVRTTIVSMISNGKISFDNLCLGADFKNIVIVACGSAYHVGEVGKQLIEQLCRVPCRAEIASEFRYSDPMIDQNTLAVFISQSGETADTLAALRLAKGKGAETLAIVNVNGSAIAGESKYVIYTKAGRETAVATTKAYSAQLAVIYALTIYFARIRGCINLEREAELTAQLALLPEKIEQTIARIADKTAEISKDISDADDIYFIGRRLDFAVALEGSLKMKEISYIHSEAYAAGELKHGTISLIEHGTPVVAVVGDTEIASKTHSNICEVESRGAKTVIVTTDKNLELFGGRDYVLAVPDIIREFSPSLLVIPLQWLSYHTAKLRGCDIDKPKNLAKSVTVE